MVADVVVDEDSAVSLEGAFLFCLPSPRQLGVVSMDLFREAYEGVVMAESIVVQEQVFYIHHTGDEPAFHVIH